jgi:Na+/H+-dicarboxylate symporter
MSILADGMHNTDNDSTAIYFPIVIVFIAQTQGTTLDATQYVIVVLLSTLASIGVTPIPSASLVLMVMICNSINLPVTGMYGVVVAIDWFVDRFRTLTNVSGDIFAAGVLQKITGIEDDLEDQMDADSAAREAQAMYDRETRVG